MEEQLKDLLEAALLVTVHGAGLAMAAFLPPRYCLVLPPVALAVTYGQSVSFI